MTIPTYYKTLGLDPSAAHEEIRAVYKSLSLKHHPDKTVALAPEERCLHSKKFNKVREAYNVLSKPATRADYDAELARHNGRVDLKRTTFHRAPSRAESTAPSTPSRRRTVKLSTPQEKASLLAKVRQQLESHLRWKTQLDEADEQLPVAELKSMVKHFKTLEEESEADLSMRIFCSTRVGEYERKIAAREREHQEWLEKMATAKHSQSTSTGQRRPTTPGAPKKPMTSSSAFSMHSSNTSRSQSTRSTSSQVSPTPAARNTARKRTEVEQAAATADVAVDAAEARLRKMAQCEAAKQALVDEKAAAFRAEKEKQRVSAELQAQEDADRIAKIRAKAGAAPLGAFGAAVEANFSASVPTSDDATLHRDQAEAQAGTPAAIQSASKQTQPNGKHLCGKCGIAHASFREWRKCNM